MYRIYEICIGMRRTMKILILANNDIGLYNFRKEIIKGFVDEKYEVHISVPSGPRVKDLTDIGSIYHEITIDRRGINPFKDLRLILEYYKLIKKVKPDLILTYTIKPNLYGGLVSRLMNVKYVTNITGIGTVFQKENILKRLVVLMYRFGLKNSEMLLFQNKENQEIFKKNNITGKSEKVIPGSGVNIIDFPFTPLQTKKEINFLFIGRLMEEKGIDEYLNVAKLMQGRNVKFHVVGPTEETMYGQKMQEYVENGIIYYHGFQKDIKKFIEYSDCLVNPSYHEGMSNVLLEAGSLGRPLIASNISGCKEIIDDSVNGYLFDVKNEKSLLNTLEKFMKLSSLEINSMSIASRKKIEEEFNRNNIVKEYVSFANKIIGGKIK